MAGLPGHGVGQPGVAIVSPVGQLQQLLVLLRLSQGLSSGQAPAEDEASTTRIQQLVTDLPRLRSRIWRQ